MGVLKDMSVYWRRLFLTVGILIAVFGNLVLVGAVAPWLARRFLARRPAAAATAVVGVSAVPPLTRPRDGAADW